MESKKDRKGTKREGRRVWIEELELDSHMGYSRGIYGLVKPFRVGA
jgi:ribosomal protein L20